MPVTSPHPSPQQWQAFSSGRLAEEERIALEAHLAECSTCCDQLAQAPDDDLVRRLRAGGTKVLASPAEETLAGHDSAAVTIPAELREHPRYHLLSVIGIGGMGIVYQAEHRLMERLVAIKVIDPKLTQKASAIARFRREVKTAARLTHPHIVSAYDAEQAGDLHFLVMEFVPGVSLARHVERQGPVAHRFAASYIRQAALGLQYAFEQGMVHRDIKPQNLMLTPQGRVKILDFGLSRFASDEVAESQQASQFPPGAKPELTTHGMVMGTPDYIAPEQIRDPRHADQRSDIYSLGCTLYFLLTGRAPFADESATQKLISHCNHEPSPEESQSIPPELLAILRKMMAKKPEDRYATPKEIAEALLPLVRPDVVSPTPPPVVAPRIEPPPIALSPPPPPPLKDVDPPDSRRTILLATGGIGAALLVLFAALLWWWKPPSPQQVLLVVPPFAFDANEVELLAKDFRAAGLKVMIASAAKTPLTSSWPGSKTIQPDVTLASVHPEEYDAFVFCQGRIGAILADGVPIVAARSRDASTPGKPAAIFAASGDALIVLKNSGLLRGQTIACPPEKLAMMRQMLQSGDVHAPSFVSTDPVVVSGTAITSQGPRFASELAAAVIKSLRGRR